MEFIRLQSPSWCSVRDRGIRHFIQSVCHLKLTIPGRHDANLPTTPLWSWHHSGLLEEDSAFDQTQFIDVSRDSTSQTKFVALRSWICGNALRDFQLGYSKFFFCFFFATVPGKTQGLVDKEAPSLFNCHACSTAAYIPQKCRFASVNTS